jgi:ketosteroid isomerase-like protein
MPQSDVGIAGAWHEALNQGDVARLLSLSVPDVEVGGPRGSGSGAELLREWVARAAIQLEPQRTYGRNGTIVVVQLARWQASDGGLGEPQPVATVFRVRDGRVASVIRFDDVLSALEAAGLDETDLVSG